MYKFNSVYVLEACETVSQVVHGKSQWHQLKWQKYHKTFFLNFKQIEMGQFLIKSRIRLKAIYFLMAYSISNKMAVPFKTVF